MVLPAKPPLKGEVPAICGRRGSFPHAAKVAAALSAAVTTAKPIEYAPNSHGRTSPKERTSLFPAALREKGSGEEGKDSHSRQWRLSMAVFLNRNKRP